YSERQKKRHLVRPGITGWAQVNGRNAISWTQKFEYDVWYVENISFFLDLKILLMTIKKVLFAEGINTQNMATTEPFNGRN
ncbi:sugar transferase, partial [Gramella sp. BOM4]|nr:sugar transferase [Christiangramia bathymodioli]